MIAFSRLGLRSRLGNHLFQYAFLRTSAERLSTKFYCPYWKGDELFELDDLALRASEPGELLQSYVEPADCPGFHSAALEISDGVDVQGYFQSERYFQREQVRRWYRFKEPLIAAARDRYNRDGALSNYVSISLRLGDFVSDYFENFYVPRKDFFLRALERTARNRHVLVFSDDMDAAADYLGDLGISTSYASNALAHEQLYLMSQCRDNICSPSTFSWWGAYLNRHEDCTVIAPQEGPFRLGSHLSNPDFWPANWQLLTSQHWLLDHRRTVLALHWARRGLRALKRRMGE